MWRNWGSIYPVWTELWQQSDPQRASQTQDGLFHVGDVFCLLLQETPTRHHGPIRELLANNTRAQCHLQLLPLYNGPHWSGLYLFIPLLQGWNERQSCLCVFIMTEVSNRNLKKDSLGESKSWGTFDAEPKWSRMLGSAGYSGFINCVDI